VRSIGAAACRPIRGARLGSIDCGGSTGPGGSRCRMALLQPHGRSIVLCSIRQHRRGDGDLLLRLNKLVSLRLPSSLQRLTAIALRGPTPRSRGLGLAGYRIVVRSDAGAIVSLEPRSVSNSQSGRIQRYLVPEFELDAGSRADERPDRAKDVVSRIPWVDTGKEVFFVGDSIVASCCSSVDQVSAGPHDACGTRDEHAHVEFRFWDLQTGHKSSAVAKISSSRSLLSVGDVIAAICLRRGERPLDARRDDEHQEEEARSLSSANCGAGR